MTILFEERLSDSPYVETVTHGRTASDGSTVRPAENHWHLVFSKFQGVVHSIFVGPLKTSGVIHYGADAEVLWIRFKIGTFIPYLPAKCFIDGETILPNAAGQSFWLNGSAWQFPDHENVETFVNRLARQEVLVADPVVNAVLQGHPQTWSPRTVRHRFLQTTGLSQNHIYQVERAKRAAALLQQGTSILDTVYELDYFDQSHLTKALKRYVGTTPAQELIRSCRKE